MGWQNAPEDEGEESSASDQVLEGKHGQDMRASGSEGDSTSNAGGEQEHEERDEGRKIMWESYIEQDI